MLLLFGSVWMFPLITALVAGDIVAAEDHNGTLKTILTRSVERGQIFAGKALAAATYAIAAILLSGAVAVVAGMHRVGLQPARDAVGHDGLGAHGARLVGGSLLVYLMPILAVACIGLLLSTVTRNSAAAVVGTLMVSLLIQLIGILPGPRRRCTRTCSARSSTPGRACCATPVDWAPIDPRGVGLRALRRCPRWSRALPGLPAPRRRGRLSAYGANALFSLRTASNRPPLWNRSTATRFGPAPAHASGRRRRGRTIASVALTTGGGRCRWRGTGGDQWLSRNSEPVVPPRFGWQLAVPAGAGR